MEQGGNRVAVIDYGVGNLGSIVNMLKKIGADPLLVREEAGLLEADRVVLPGVGAFDHGMQNLQASGLIPALSKAVLDEHKPLLAICLGMQLLSDGSEEGTLPGLGWLEASTFRFHPDDPSLKVPHMGWAHVRPEGSSMMFKDIDSPRFYFLHSFFVRCSASEQVAATTDYGETFDSAAARENIWAVQFHPEKSHRFGMQLFRNFVSFSG